MKVMLSYCPLCHRKYQTEDIYLIGKRENVELFYLSCANCGKANLSYSVNLYDSVTSISLTTDLSYQDATRLEKLDPINLVTELNSENASFKGNNSLYKEVLDNFGKLT